MDMNKHLILVKNVDKTAEIKSCKFEHRKCLVTFTSGTKEYTYRAVDIQWFRNPTYKDGSTHIVYENNQPIANVETILDFGSHTRLVHKSGFSQTYPSTHLHIEETCLTNKNAQHVFHYLQALSNHVSVSVDGSKSLLKYQYDKLTSISPRSVLSSYLEGKPLSHNPEKPQLIFPFGFNLSQKAAVEKAMTEQVSIIEGPPGTGKTQTILNIISNAYMNGKTVAVVSNNNSATANVLEKLDKYGVGFIAAYLGSKQNRTEFFENQSVQLPTMSSWSLSHEERHKIRTQLTAAQNKLDEMLAYKNKQAKLKQELSNLKTEYGYFKNYYEESKLDELRLKAVERMSSQKLLKFMIEYKEMVKDGPVSFKNKIYNLVVYGIFNLKLMNNHQRVSSRFFKKSIMSGERLSWRNK